ncbi:HAD family hydrolase [Streptomyces hypolithicus]
MTVTGVLFDFSGTLLRIEPTAVWLRAAFDSAEIDVPENAFSSYARQLEECGALPGGAAPRRVPPHLAELWATRDQSAERHRAAYTGLARQVALPHPRLYDALYDRHTNPAAWHPYPDSAEVLAELARRGVAIAVVSNVGWDLRPVFRAHGLGEWVDAYVLSYEHGIQKPDPRLFRVACEALGHEPRDVVMVGDDRRADGGAAELGCAVHFVDHLPPGDRPHGLRPVLALAD